MSREPEAQMFARTPNITVCSWITDILRAIRDKTVLKASSDYIVRDFLHPSDFYGLVCALLAAPSAHAAVDCCSRAPIDKTTLLAAKQKEFGFRYETTEAINSVNATGSKPHYYSQNNRASEFGYQSALTLLEVILQEATAIFLQQASLVGRS